MTSSSLIHSVLPLARDVSSAPTPARVGPPATSFLKNPGLFSALVAIAGGALAVAGGGLRPGAFNLLPREDGLFTAGVFVVIAAFGYGLRERWAYLVCLPIVSISFYGILRFHQAPYALFGAELAVIGIVGLAFQRWRSWARRNLA